jgi:cytochrome b subunit of formate dehydrogenase
MHHALALLVFTSMCTGLVLLKKIGIPLLPRNPDLLSLRAWGWVYVVHDLAAVSAVTLVMIHVYFGVIPENRMYLKAMISGRMSRADQRARVTAFLKGGR